MRIRSLKLQILGFLERNLSLREWEKGWMELGFERDEEEEEEADEKEREGV